VIHARLVLPHQTFVYVHMYADPTIKGGRFAYALATLEGMAWSAHASYPPYYDTCMQANGRGWGTAALYHVSHRLGPQALGEPMLDDALAAAGAPPEGTIT
jgi:hypothetical protein